MPTLLATCSTLISAMAASSDGGTITLRGDCPAIVITAAPRRALVIEAAGATVRGLTFQNARNIIWRGGTIRAAEGPFAKGPPGYGARVVKSANIGFEGVTFTDANRGLVGDDAVELSVKGSTFHRLGQDGMILSQMRGLVVSNNIFRETIGKPSTCAYKSQIVSNVPGRDCKARGGLWTDGYHADAIQMRNGVTNALISDNNITGPTQGITQMDTSGDAALANIVIERNFVSTDAYHRITLTDCVNCSIKMNKVMRAPGSTRRAVILAGAATACGNIAQDERARDPKC